MPTNRHSEQREESSRSFVEGEIPLCDRKDGDAIGMDAIGMTEGSVQADDDPLDRAQSDSTFTGSALSLAMRADHDHTPRTGWSKFNRFRVAAEIEGDDEPPADKLALVHQYDSLY